MRGCLATEVTDSACGPGPLHSKIGAVDEKDLKRLLDANVLEIQRHFDVTAERLEKKVELVVEAVAQLDEKRERDTEEMRQEMRRGFADTQAMIKFSHE